VRLILVPRHPERAAEVVSKLGGLGLSALRRTSLAEAGGRSAREAAGPTAEVIVVDTVGELREVYRAATVVFVGGSLVPHGGQNPLEPAALSRPVLFGPHMEHFRTDAAALESGGGAVRVADAAALEREIDRLLADAGAREEMGRRAREVVASRRGATERTMAMIRRLLDDRRAVGSGGGRPRTES